MPKDIPHKGKLITAFTSAGRPAGDRGKHAIALLYDKKHVELAERALTAASVLGADDEDVVDLGRATPKDAPVGLVPPLYFYKRFTAEEKPFAPWEAAFGAIYQMTIPNAKGVYAVYDSDGSILGVVSEAYDGFVPLKDDDRSVDSYVEDGLVPVLWEHDMWGEDDGHGKNIGSIPKLNAAGRKVPGRFVKIDHDNSGYTEIVKIKGERRMPGTNTLVPGLPADYEKAFALRPQDIENFPLKQREEHEKYDTPYYFPTVYRAEKSWTDPKAYSAEQVAKFSALRAHPKTKYQVFEQALVDLLIPPENFLAIGKAHIRDPKMRKIFTDFTCNRQAELANAIFQLPNFRVFIRQNRHILKDIQERFAIYSAGLADEDAFLRIDPKHVERQFDQVWRRAHENGIVWGLHGLTSFAKTLPEASPKVEIIQTLYKQVLDLTLRYYDNPTPTQEVTGAYVEECERLITEQQLIFLSADEMLGTKWKRTLDRLLAPLISLINIETPDLEQSLSGESVKDSSYYPPEHIIEQYNQIDRSGLEHMNILIGAFSHEFYKWLLNESHQSLIVSELNKAIDEYLPPDSYFAFGVWKAWTRNRVPEVSKFKKQYPNLLRNHPLFIRNLINIIQSDDPNVARQDWQSTSSFTVTVLNSLYTNFVKDFKRKSLLLQLKENDQLCIFYDYVIRGFYNAELPLDRHTLPSLKRIYQNLETLSRQDRPQEPQRKTLAC